MYLLHSTTATADKMTHIHLKLLWIACIIARGKSSSGNVKDDEAHKYFLPNTFFLSVKHIRISLVVSQLLAAGKPLVRKIWEGCTRLYVFVYSSPRLRQLVLIEEIIWTSLPGICADKTF